MFLKRDSCHVLLLNVLTFYTNVSWQKYWVKLKTCSSNLSSPDTGACAIFSAADHLLVIGFRVVNSALSCRRQILAHLKSEMTMLLEYI